MTNVNDNATMLLRYMLEKGLIAPNGISSKELQAAVCQDDDEFNNAENFILQAHFVEGGGGSDGIRWLTPEGVKYITEEIKQRTPISIVAERLLGILIRDAKDDDSPPLHAIITELKITPDEYMQVSQELVDFGFVEKTYNIADDNPKLFPTKEGRLAFREGFQAPVSIPSIHAGAIFNGPINGGNIQAIANAFDSEIQQNVSSLSLAELQKEIDQTLQKLESQITQDLSYKNA